MKGQENYTLAETENLTGTTGATVTPNVKEYTGFTSPNSGLMYPSYSFTFGVTVAPVVPVSSSVSIWV